MTALGTGFMAAGESNKESISIPKGLHKKTGHRT
jgi:hypothetical protein